MDMVMLIGTLAMLASTTSFTPQAWKIIKSRRTKDISAPMYVVTVLGFGLWSAYGFLLGQWPIIVTNLICLALSGFILAMKLLPERQKQAVADKLDPAA